MLRKLSAALLAFASVATGRGLTAPTPAAQIVHNYVKAIGGEAVLNRVTTREIQAHRYHGSKLVYYWQKPDSVLLVEGKEKTGWVGGSGWVLSKKKRVSKLPKGAERPLEIDANPLRYAQLLQLYPDARSVASEEVDGQKMDLIQAPNDRGVTKFYFDCNTHLLRRINDMGESSAYFRHITDFFDYQDVDGLKFPFRIVHTSNESNTKPRDIRISQVNQNVPLKPGLFTKPSAGAVVLGGKR